MFVIECHIKAHFSSFPPFGTSKNLGPTTPLGEGYGEGSNRNNLIEVRDVAKTPVFAQTTAPLARMHGQLE